MLRDTDPSTVSFDEIQPDIRNNWLNQSNTDFASLMPLANRETKYAKTASNENAVFKLNALGVGTNRDEWVYDFAVHNLRDKVFFFSDIYNELLNDDDYSFDMAIKWSRDLRNEFRRGRRITYNDANRLESFYRPFVKKHQFADSVMNDVLTRNHFEIFGQDLEHQNKVICFCVNKKTFYVLAADKLFDLHFTGDTQCLPLYRYTPEGERISNITEWGLRQVREHYSDDGITAEDIFAYTYASLHDPKYREAYATDLLQEFPRLSFHPDFYAWANLGQKLLDLHIGFESATPWNLNRVEQQTAPGKPRLRADKERGTITLDNQTTLTGIPASAWQYRLGSRSALEWVLDQYKERKPRDPTIRERFNTYRFADHKQHVIDLLKRVTTVSVETVRIVNQLAELSDIEPAKDQQSDPEAISLSKSRQLS